MPTIYGDTLDDAGRCTHYHSEKDVIANKCATCNKYWACYECHAAATDHSFGAMDLKSRAVLCGACGHEMTFADYTAISTFKSQIRTTSQGYWQRLP